MKKMIRKTAGIVTLAMCISMSSIGCAQISSRLESTTAAEDKKESISETKETTVTETTAVQTPETIAHGSFDGMTYTNSSKRFIMAVPDETWAVTKDSENEVSMESRAGDMVALTFTKSDAAGGIQIAATEDELKSNLDPDGELIEMVSFEYDEAEKTMKAVYKYKEAQDGFNYGMMYDKITDEGIYQAKAQVISDEESDMEVVKDAVFACEMK